MRSYYLISTLYISTLEYVQFFFILWNYIYLMAIAPWKLRPLYNIYRKPAEQFLYSNVAVKPNSTTPRNEIHGVPQIREQFSFLVDLGFFIAQLWNFPLTS